MGLGDLLLGRSCDYMAFVSHHCAHPSRRSALNISSWCGKVDSVVSQSHEPFLG
jgi:hypothetical protein